MPTLGLLNVYSTANLGDAAMYAAYERLLAGDVQRSSSGHSSEGCAVVAEGERADCDAYVSVGGDIFNNARPRLLTRRFARNLASLWRAPRDRTFVFGQSIPASCRGVAFLALSRTLARLSSVYVRDYLSFSRLEQAGVRPILGYDPAFALSVSDAARARAAAVYDLAGIAPDRAALLSVRSFNNMYRHDAGDFLAKMVALCRGLLKRGHHPVVLLQATVNTADSDLAVAATLRRHVPEIAFLDPWSADPGCPTWEVAAGCVALAGFVFGVRYHTSVFRMLAGRSAFSIYYSNKGRDLVDRLRQPGCALERFDADAAIAAIELAAERHVAADRLREEVTADFASCLGKALGHGAPIR